LANLEAIDKYIDDHLDASLAELSKLCAQPSVSASGQGIKECAGLVSEMLRRRGFAVELFKTAGHPVIYAEAPGTSDRTLLFYNHYDVQPPEPLELWTTPAFEPTIRDGALYARGSADDKGHIMCRLAALDAVKAITGAYPCRIKFVIEGEEETSSVHLHEFVESQKDRLKADGCVWEFGTVDHEERPVEILGLRGICYVELRAKTASTDAHSGLGGSIFPNAAWRLVWALNTLKDQNENILIPGFYDNVKQPTAYDMELLNKLPDTAEYLLKTYELKGFLKGIKSGVELHREEVFVPTCTICGLTSGYQGPGSKTVLPAQASAKVDFRLVPDQDPEDIVKKLRKHLDAQGFSDIEIAYLGGERPGRTDPGDPFVKLTIDAARDAYGKEMLVSPMIGGSGPNALFLDHVKVPVVTAGVGYPGSRAHAPDEHMRIDHFVKGTKHTARIAIKMGEW